MLGALAERESVFDGRRPPPRAVGGGLLVAPPPPPPAASAVNSDDGTDAPSSNDAQPRRALADLGLAICALIAACSAQSDWIARIRSVVLRDGDFSL